MVVRSRAHASASKAKLARGTKDEETTMSRNPKRQQWR